MIERSKAPMDGDDYSSVASEQPSKLHPIQHRQAMSTIPDMDSQVSEIRDFLKSKETKLNMQDLYFRNQERLMQNSIIPISERKKQKLKSNFQMQHCNSLAIPNQRQARDKHKLSTDGLSDRKWQYNSNKPKDLKSSRLGSNSIHSPRYSVYNSVTNRRTNNAS